MRLQARRAGLWVRQVVLRPLLRAARPLLFPLAALWRRLLIRTTFIAITGSVGKTTTKELLGRVLASRGRTYRTIGTQNAGILIPLNVLRVRPWHRFAVLEIGIAEPGYMRRAATVVRPDVAIVVSLARVHTRGFADPEQYVAEKALLLESLAPGGLAVLNGDDPRIAGMAKDDRFAVCRVGTSPGLDFWADDVSSAWPERLTFRGHHGEDTCIVRTQQLGAHWIPSLLAALATARRLGVSLQEAAATLSTVPPYTARLEPVPLPNGAVLIRDDYSASIDTFEASLRVLREARAGRRVLVISDFSDSGLHYRARLKALGAATVGWLDLLVLISREHKYGSRKAIEAGMSPGQVRGFASAREAAGFLRTELRRGDLVLLKGRTTDHIARVFFGQIGSVSCWLEYCPKTMLCDGCWELGFHPDGSYVPPSVGLRA